MTDDTDKVVPIRKRPPGPGRGNRVKQGNGASVHGSAGDGWGGPKRGDAAIRGPDALIPAQPPEKRALSIIKNRAQAEVADEMRQKLYDLAHTAEREETQLSAASKLLDRIEGTPVQRVLGAGTTPEDMLGIQVEFVRPAVRE